MAERAFVTLIAFAGVLGLLVGSFLNVVIHRLPLGESIAFPASHCPACKTPIHVWDNVPILGYLWLRGRCRSCGVAISPRYPAVEAFTGIVFALIAWRFGASLEALVWMLFSASLIAAGMVDLDHQIIPDEISLGGLGLGLVGMPALLMWRGDSLGHALGLCWGGALLGGGVLWTVGFLHARLSVWMEREFEHWPGEGEEIPKPSQLDYWVWFPGMGFGDVKLLAMIGAFVGPYGVMLTIVVASLVGLVLGLGWLLVTRRFDSPFGFAPAIAVGALVVLLAPLETIGLG